MSSFSDVVSLSSKRGLISCDPLDGTVDLERLDKKIKSAIYCFFNNKTDRMYVGKTTNLRSRISRHNQSIIDAREKDPFHSAVRQSPDDFYFGILSQGLEASELSQKEREMIELYDTVENGYNQNKGGGGGTSAEECSSPTTALRLEGLEGKDLSTITPEKYYPLEVDPNTGRIAFKFTPTARTANVVYCIKDENGKRYIGETGTSLSERMSKHTWLANHPAAKQSNEIYSVMREHPEEIVGVGILHSCEKPQNAPGMEKALIKAKKSRKCEGGGYNKTAGGNGSFPEKLGRTPPKKRKLSPIVV